jgi:outer membrane protein assembly factor BamB
VVRAAVAAVAALVVCATASASSPDISSTHVIWTARLSAPVGTPAVADGHIYVATGAKHTRLHALDATTGRRLWQAIGGFGTRYAPLAANGIVLRLSDADSLRRYDPASGRVFWNRPGVYSEGFLAPPLLANGRMVELSDSLDVRDATTGQQLWTAADDCFRCRVAADATRLYVAGKQGLRAFDAATGAVLWHTTGFAALNTVASPTLANGTIVAVEHTLSGKVWSFFLEGFRASDGHAVWHTKLADTEGFDPWTAPVSSGRIAVFVTVDGTLHALDTRTGAVRWAANVGLTGSVPAIGDGVVWIVGGDNRLHALSETTGEVLWSGPPMKVDASAATPSPVLDGDIVLVGTAAGNLLAFGRR